MFMIPRSMYLSDQSLIIMIEVIKVNLIQAEFWKVVTIVKNDDDHSISSTAYLQTQKQLIEDLKFVFGEYKTYQVSISKIESLTGLDFGDLRNFDPFSKRKDIIPVRIINDEKDIIL